MSTELCEHCNEPVIVVLLEPDAKPTKLTARDRVCYRLINVTPSYQVAVAERCHDLHSLTCTAINGKST